jgi:ABC-type Fe3+-hydroxamate transport system substrate-binding protein
LVILFANSRIISRYNLSHLLGCVLQHERQYDNPETSIRGAIVLQVAVACHVPKALAEEKGVGVKEWFETVTKAMEGEVEIKEETDEIIIGLCHASTEKQLFALKMRDAGSSAGYQMLLKKGLIPQDGVQASLT